MPRPRGTRRFALVAGTFVLLAGAFVSACRRGPEPAAGSGAGEADMAWRTAVESAETPLDDALARFDRVASDPDPEIRRAAAREVLGAARDARERLERLNVPAELESAQREELVFLNHVVPAFREYEESPSRPGGLDRLASILARGRAHRNRARPRTPDRM